MGGETFDAPGVRARVLIDGVRRVSPRFVFKGYDDAQTQLQDHFDTLKHRDRPGRGQVGRPGPSAAAGDCRAGQDHVASARIRDFSKESRARWKSC